ncbi:MAG: RND family transporter, partial [Bacteroidia bacterium]|nr:RND family transporter [Bacteroidia bacterium]
MTNSSERIGRFAEWIIKYRWMVLIISIAIAMAAGSGGQNLTFNNDYHIFFDDDNPQVLAFDGLQEKYTKDDNVFIVISPKDGKVFTQKTLAAIEDLEKRAWQVPFSTRVDALSNYQHTRAEGDDMYVEAIATNALDKSDAEIASIKEIVMNEPLLVSRLVNHDASVTAVNVNISAPADSMDAQINAMNFARAMVEEWNTEY